MREIIFRNLTGETAKKRDISVEEIVERNGLVSSTKKRSLYFIRGIHKIKSKEEMQAWIDERRRNTSLNKKFFHILRRYSSHEHADNLMCKMRGSFYVISGQSAYNIVFVHAIKIKMHKMGV